jgi:uncharacterized protein
MTSSVDDACIINKVRVDPKFKIPFADWQAKFNASIAAFPGFLSLEILSPMEPDQQEWTIVQRFYTKESAASWRASEERHLLQEDLQIVLQSKAKTNIREVKSEFQKATVTEVFVTQVSPDKENDYRQWIAKIHQVEAKFPGFRGVYVQSPSPGLGRNWITLLQFNTPDNLDRWLSSTERQEVLLQSKSLIDSLERHRVISPYSGWFASISKGCEAPSLWKQTMIILLVLFPIIMLELKFLSPLTSSLNPAVGTFIGNALSVTLISWPFMPIAIWFLGWWLSPQPHQRLRATLMGTVVVLLLYLLEILLLWNLL